MIEWGEVYAKEGAQLAPSMTPPVEETSMFAGSLMALPQGIKHGWDVAASAMANAAMPVLEKVTPDSMSAWLEDQRRVANESMKATRTDPRTMGTVGQLIHGVSSILTMGVAGAPLGPVGAAGAIGGLSMFQKATELIEQGVDLQTAQKVGAVTGTVMGVGAALPPFMGGTLTKQIASGIGINVGLGAAERAGSAAILEDKYAGIAQHYKALDGTAIAIDAVLGAAFPIGARMLRKPSVAQIDDAQDANRVVAEQSRDPALQATLEGIERHREIADDVTRQILEDNRPLGDIEIPANAMDDVVPNEQFGQTVALAAKAIDDLMVQESGKGVGQVEADISTLAKAFNKGADDAIQVRGAEEVDVRKQTGDGEEVAKGNATEETTGTLKTKEEVATPLDKWFGSSQVINEFGEPRVLYHTSYKVMDAPITEFDRNWLVKNQRKATSIDSIGTWFSDNPSLANQYGGGAMYPSYARITKPMVYKTFGALKADWENFHYAGMASKSGEELHSKNKFWGDSDGFVKYLQKEGYDGIIIPRHKGDVSAEFSKQSAYIVFDSKNIKSVFDDSAKVGADTTAKVDDVDPWIAPKTFAEKFAAFKDALLSLQREFGWAEVGGKLIRQQEAGDLGLGTGEVLGRTQWLPKADWWPGKPKSLTEKTGNELVQKVLEGKSLTKADKANLEFLVSVMQEQKKQKAMGIAAKADEIVARPDEEIEAGMVARLAKIDEGIVENLATRFEDTDAFMKAVKEALDEYDAKQGAERTAAKESQGTAEPFQLTGQTEAEIRAAETARVKAEAEAKAKAAAPSPDGFRLTGSDRAADVGAAAGQTSIFDASPDQFTKQAARGIIESDPTMTVMDENGQAVVAKDLLDQAETRFQQETKEADLFKVAVACAIGVGE